MKKYLLTTFVLVFCFNFSFSQKINSENYEVFIEEVYGGTPYMTDELKEIYIQRMEKVEVKKWDGKDYPVLGTIMLRSKYHPEIDYDKAENFDPNKFNPLKYFFNFNGEDEQILRVYGTNYMIVIDPNTTKK